MKLSQKTKLTATSATKPQTMEPTMAESAEPNVIPAAMRVEQIFESEVGAVEHKIAGATK
jgi:hypothetical protein